MNEVVTDRKLYPGADQMVFVKCLHFLDNLPNGLRLSGQ